MRIPLTQLSRRETGIIKRLEGGAEFQRKISDLGVRVGKRVKIISSQPFRGPLVIKISSMTIAIGRGMASKIIVDVI